MSRITLSVIFFLQICSDGLSQTATEQIPGSSDQAKVGVTTREYIDDSRSNWAGNGHRQLRVVICYPNDGDGVEEGVEDHDQFTKRISLFHDGKISAKHEQYPLIVLSHGSGGNANQMRWLGYYLSQHGYITVAINHSGTPEEEKQIGVLTLSEYCIWERPRDISAVLNAVLSDPSFSKIIDTNRIGVAGFSLGGASAIWVAGARLDLEYFKRNAPKLPADLQEPVKKLIDTTKDDPIVQASISHAEESFKDVRIKAVFALAPAIGYGFTEKGLRDIDIPIYIVVGDSDIVTPLEINAKHYADHISKAKLIILPGERGHYIKDQNKSGKGAELEEVSKLAFDFFEQPLKSAKKKR
jgi:predicted dienelactone hydrolase